MRAAQRRRIKWWQVMLVVYGAVLVTTPIDDRFLSRVVAASITGLFVEMLLTWDDVR